ERTLSTLLAEDPHDEDASAALEEIYVDSEQRDKLIALLTRKLQPLAGSARARVLCTIAALQDDGAHEAIRTLLERALEADPQHLPAYDALAQLHAQRGAHAELAALLARQLGAVDGAAQRSALLLRLGALHEAELADPAGAAEHYAQLVALAPGHEQANTALA